MTLLDLLSRYCHTRKDITLFAAHFNHQLRPEANDEQRQVEDYCNKIDVQLIIGTGDVAGIAASRKIAIHAVARELRYNFFSNTLLLNNSNQNLNPIITTGHHLDDQVETVLMKLFSGAGVEGLSGIGSCERWSSGVTVIRPLLGLRRKQIEQYCKFRGLPFVTDQSNADLRYPRNRIRHKLLPIIEDQFGTSTFNGIARSSHLMALTSELMSDQTDKIWKDIAKFHNEQEIVLDYCRFCSYLTMLRLLVLQQAIRHLDQTDNNVSEDQRSHDRRSLERVESADKFICAGSQGIIELGNGIKLCNSGSNIYVYRSIDMFDDITVTLGQNADIPVFGSIEIESIERNQCTVLFIDGTPPPPDGLLYCDMDKLKGEQFTIKSADFGDKIHTLGMTGHHKVTDILRENGIPIHRRRYPTVWVQDQLVAIPPFRIAEPFKVTGATKRIIMFTWQASKLATFYKNANAK